MVTCSSNRQKAKKTNQHTNMVRISIKFNTILFTIVFLFVERKKFAKPLKLAKWQFILALSLLLGQ